MPVYSGYFAAMYDALCPDYQWDLDFYRNLARSGDVLELGCGSGRVAIALARAGRRVVGVDRSRDMVHILRRNLAREADAIAERVEIELEDMRHVALTRKFNLVVLPANNISLLASAEDRLAVFQRAVDHLAPGGCFAFDNAMADEDRLLAQNDDVTMIPAESASGRHFILASHRYVPADRTQLMNFYAEKVGKDGITKRYLGSWTKAVITEEEITELLARTGLRVFETKICELEYDRRRMKLYACRRD